MAKLKCIGCGLLKREIVTYHGNQLVAYNCIGLHPYAVAISGLLRPSAAITRAAEKCHVDPTKHCIICGTGRGLTTYGIEVLRTCVKHYKAWSKWLDEHPDKEAAMRPLGRIRDAAWIDVFREFVEDMRQPA